MWHLNCVSLADTVTLAVHVKVEIERESERERLSQRPACGEDTWLYKYTCTFLCSLYYFFLLLLLLLRTCGGGALPRRMVRILYIYHCSTGQ